MFDLFAVVARLLTERLPSHGRFDKSSDPRPGLFNTTQLRRLIGSTVLPYRSLATLKKYQAKSPSSLEPDVGQLIALRAGGGRFRGFRSLGHFRRQHHENRWSYAQAKANTITVHQGVARESGREVLWIRGLLPHTWSPVGKASASSSPH